MRFSMPMRLKYLIHDDNMGKLNLKIKKIMRDLENCLDNNRFKINTKKSLCTNFSKQTSEDILNIPLYGEVFNLYTQAKFLGLHGDNSIKWEVCL